MEVEIDSKEIGESLGRANDFQQSKLLNMFGLSLASFCGGTIEYETQCHKIASDLNVHGKKLIETLNGFIPTEDQIDIG